MTSPSCWPQLISRERWSCYLLRCFHAAAFMAATLPSRCKSLSNAGTGGGVRGGGVQYVGERGGQSVCQTPPPPPDVPWQGKLQQPLNWAPIWPSSLETLVDRIKSLSLRGGGRREGGRVYLCKCVFVCVSTDVTGLYMFNTKWRLTILCQLVIPSSSLKD